MPRLRPRTKASKKRIARRKLALRSKVSKSVGIPPLTGKQKRKAAAKAT